MIKEITSTNYAKNKILKTSKNTSNSKHPIFSANKTESLNKQNKIDLMDKEINNISSKKLLNVLNLIYFIQK